MILRLSRLHRAHYDDSGNIVLHDLEAEDAHNAPVVHEEYVIAHDHALAHETLNELLAVPGGLLRTVRRNVSGCIGKVTSDITSEYRSAAAAGAQTLRDLACDVLALPQRIATAAMQPVVVVRPKREARKYARGTLFVLDALRFGTAFAALFGGLFFALNYQSYSSIVLAYVRPSLQSPAQISEQATIMREHLERSPALAVAGAGRVSLASLLQVGPPENRLIVPKLEMNVPIVSPPVSALMQEDWKQLEADIQTGLEDGVVHYPGTANPGQAGNFFLTGHSSYYPWAAGKYKTIFARLQELEVGDEYWVYYGGDEHKYLVRSKREVKPSDVSVLDQPINKRYGTLMTCTPVGTTLRRLVLVSEEVDPETGESLAVGQHTQQLPTKIQMEQLAI